MPYGLAETKSRDSNPDLTLVGEWEWDVDIGHIEI